MATKWRKGLAPGKAFSALTADMAAKGNVSDPAAVAASIGRKKYGAKGMAAKAAAGRKRIAWRKKASA